MATVVVVCSSLQADDSRPKSYGLVWRLMVCIHRMKRVNSCIGLAMMTTL